MKARRIVLTLPFVVTAVAIAATHKPARADAGDPDGGVASSADAGDGGDDVDGGEGEATGCGAAAPPNGAVTFGAGCC